MKLPIFITSIKELMLMQTGWSGILGPLVSSPSNQASLLKDIAVTNGTTVINHLLGQKLQGWRVVGINAAATLYDQQASNPTPELTLILVSNAACTISLEVF